MDHRPTQWRTRLRQVVNALNLSTLLGLLVATLGRAQLHRGPEGLVLATSYRIGFPKAGAFTMGNVVLTRMSYDELTARPRLLTHEGRHATQWAWCIGPVFLPLYLGAAGWSLVRSGHPALANVFERRAGLADGGYVPSTGDTAHD